VSSVFWVSYALLWILAILMAFRLMPILRAPRQGMLPAPDDLPMSDHGLPSGWEFPVLKFPTAEGDAIDLTSDHHKGTLVVLTMPGCKACVSLYPLLAAYMKEHAEIQTVMLSFMMEDRVIDEDETEALALPWIGVPKEAQPQFSTTIFPFGYFLSPDGTILRKGVLNTVEHLSLITSAKAS
jgi:hypothetical protein